jgi:hypothetical protein
LYLDAIKPKMIGAKVEVNVETKLYALTTFPEF